MVDGAKIKSLREGRELSQAELGNLVGTNQAHISHIEIGFKNPSASVLKRIAECFGVTVDGLYK